MKKSDTIKQISVIACAALLCVFLFSRDIKGLVKPSEHNDGATPNAPANPAQMPPMAKKEIKSLSIEDILTEATKTLGEDKLSGIKSLTQKFEKANDQEKQQLATQLSSAFLKINNPGGAAYFQEFTVPLDKQNVQQWLKIGDQYLDAFNLLQSNEGLQSSYLQSANKAYTKVLQLDSANLDAKTGQGITIVNGLGMPMQGISKLLEVVQKDPKNLKANVNLGLFSMKSGQFDKAIERFETVISIQPDAEAYFYLATANENLGKTKEAIAAYLKSKELAKNPTLTDFIDKKIMELQKKN